MSCQVNGNATRQYLISKSTRSLILNIHMYPLIKPSLITTQGIKETQGTMLENEK